MNVVCYRCVYEYSRAFAMTINLVTLFRHRHGRFFKREKKGVTDFGHSGCEFGFPFVLASHFEFAEVDRVAEAARNGYCCSM
jgi:hypothetical protein